MEYVLGAGYPGRTVLDPDAGIGKLKADVLGALEDLYPAVADVIPPGKHWAAGVYTGYPVGVMPDLVHSFNLERFECLVQHRYHCTPAPATVELEEGRARVVFDAPELAVTAGQGAAFYRGDQLLGGGWIAGTRRAGEVVPRST